MTDCYYLGANSSNGFYSLYKNFPNSEDAMLHIIKGGPGTGKSTLMKKIGKLSKDRGLDVEYVLCSGDPESLDGVYVPAFKQAWVDGTAPHVIEPNNFGVDGDYINLGVFCRNDFDSEEKREFKALSYANKQAYYASYKFLNAADRAMEALTVTEVSPDIEEKIRERIFSA